MNVLGGIEAGGTKMVCAVGTGPDDLRELVTFPTTDPDETLERTIAFFKGCSARPEAVGIGAFGPVDPDPDSDTFGYITTTPKPGWAGTRFAGRIADAMNVPVGFDTDVNAAALGEATWGAAKDMRCFIYLTVGTGIGGGGLIDGRRMHGLIHPEMGHVLLPKAEGDAFPGSCPYHGCCLEGLASGPAIQARWSVPASALPPDHIAWEFEAHYLATALANFIVTLSPQRIILGGGVMQQPQLMPMIRTRLLATLNDYVQSPELTERIDQFVVAPGLGNRSGVLGAIALAKEALSDEVR